MSRRIAAGFACLVVFAICAGAAAQAGDQPDPLGGGSPSAPAKPASPPGGGATSVSEAMPATPLRDNFNRPDGGLGPNWPLITTTGQLVIQSNVVKSPGGLDGHYWSPGQFGPDTEVFATTAGMGGQFQAKAESTAFRAFTSGNFRENLARLTGGIPEGAHAHHVFPRRFEQEFASRNININDPRYGAWWEESAHLRASAQYNREWQDFLAGNPNRDQVIEFGRQQAHRYGLDVGY